MKKIIGIALLLFTGFSCTENQKITIEEVNQVIHRFDEGWKNKKAIVVDSLLSSQYSYFTQSGGTFDRANVVQTAGSPDYQLDLMDRQVVSVNISGNTAVVNTTWRGK